MKVPVYDVSNKEIGSVDLPKDVFGVGFNSSLVHQVLTAERANKRRPWAHTKGRGEVRGGGKKPWRQKHTGRARVGSTRSPIWVHGGVALGPRNDRTYEQKVNRKMKRGALFCLLSKKLKDGNVKVLDEFTIAAPKTKEAVSVFKSVLPKKSTSSLVVLNAKNQSAVRAIRNLPKMETAQSESISLYAVAKAQNIIFEKAAVLDLVKRYQRV